MMKITTSDEPRTEEGQQQQGSGANNCPRSVSFGTIQVREYERVIDNSMYLGLSLGWDYNESEIAAIPSACTMKEEEMPDRRKSTINNDDDDDSQFRGEVNGRVRRKKNHQRFSIFLHYGYTRKQIQKAIGLHTKSLSNSSLASSTKRSGDGERSGKNILSRFKHFIVPNMKEHVSRAA